MEKASWQRDTSLKNWVGGYRLRNRKNLPSREAEEHRWRGYDSPVVWGKMRGGTGKQIKGPLKKRSLGFYSREGGDTTESAFLEDQVGSQIGGGYMGSRGCQIRNCWCSPGGN